MSLPIDATQAPKLRQALALVPVDSALPNRSETTELPPYSDVTATLGLPAAPRVQFSERTVAAGAALARELSTALHAAERDAAALNEQDPQGNAVDAAGERMLRQFMRLRLLNGHHGMRELQRMAEVSARLQETYLHQQQAAVQEAHLLAAKAQREVARLDTTRKFISAAMCLTAAAAVGFSVGVPALLIGTAMGALLSNVSTLRGKSEFDLWAPADTTALTLTAVVCAAPWLSAASGCILGSTSKLAQQGLTMTQSLAYGGQAWFEFQASRAQLAANEKAATSKSLSTLGRIVGLQYRTIQDTLRTFQQSHMRAAEATRRLLKGTHQTSQMILKNLLRGR